MARTRIRTVKPDLFRHDGLFEAEQSSGLPLRLAFIALFTIADREGRFRWQPRRMKLDMFPYDAIDIAAVLDALHAHGFIARYEVDAEVYGFIPSWANHQTINHKEQDSELPAPSEESTVVPRKAREDLGIPVGNGNRKGMGIGREVEGNGVVRRSRVIIPEQLSDVVAHFLMVKSTAEEAERFWNHYESQGWKKANGLAITNWRPVADQWIKNPTTQKGSNGTPKQTPTDGRGGERTFAAVAEESAARLKRWGIDGTATQDQPRALAEQGGQQLANGT